MEKEKKLQIIRAAHKRFTKHGLNKTTLDEVARDLRMGKATLYHYFTSKEDLYYHSLRFEITSYLTELKNIFNENIELKGRFTAFFLLKENFQLKYKLIYDLVLHIITETEFPNEKEIFNEMLNSEEDFLREAISNGLKKKDHSPKELAYIFSRQGWNFIFRKKFQVENEDPESSREIEMLLQFIESNI
jgi:AcrR family transcriptional regulator